ncbi:MAG: transcription termination/antitermination factor NusG [Anaerolineaceae bacterium]|nr:transcription termination/antitermination factor NusG [Anaerolineaceae bacterium]
MRIIDPRQFLLEIVSTQGLYTTNEIEDYLRDAIVSKLNTILGKNLKTVFDLGQYYPQIETGVKAEVTDFFNAMGIELTDLIISGIVPPEEVQEKIFPGYVLVKMVLDDESWLLVRSTQGVTAFIGAGNKPTPISEKEVEAIQQFMKQEEPLYKTSYTVGEAVKIVDGPLTDFLGTVDNIDETHGKLKILVTLFGRETTVELDFLQVKKI